MCLQLLLGASSIAGLRRQGAIAGHHARPRSQPLPLLLLQQLVHLCRNIRPIVTARLFSRRSQLSSASTRVNILSFVGTPRNQESRSVCAHETATLAKKKERRTRGGGALVSAHHCAGGAGVTCHGLC